MQTPSREAKLAAWQAAEQAIRGKLAAPGTLSLAQVSELQPQEFFERIGKGELPCPPFGHLIDFIPLEWEPGRFVFQGTPDARHYNPLGSVHGGYAATLLDSCMGCAIHTRLKPGQGYTTTDLRISYVRALSGNIGPIRAEAGLLRAAPARSPALGTSAIRTRVNPLTAQTTGRQEV